MPLSKLQEVLSLTIALLPAADAQTGGGSAQPVTHNWAFLGATREKIPALVVHGAEAGSCCTP